MGHWMQVGYENIAMLEQHLTSSQYTHFILGSCYLHMPQQQSQNALQRSIQGDHSADNVKFPDITLTVRDTPPWHSAC